MSISAKQKTMEEFMNREQKLVQLQEALTKGRTEYDRTTGQLENYKTFLKDNFDLTSVKAGQAEVERLESEIEELRNKIDSLIPDLEEKLSEWM